MRKCLIVLAALAAPLLVPASRVAAATPTLTVTHLPPPGGSSSACLAPALAKLRAGYPVHHETQSLAAMEADLRAHAPCRGTTLVVRPLSTSSSACINCFKTYSITACDNRLTCYVAPTNFTANWSESFTVRFEYRMHLWVEGGSAFPGTYTRVAQASVPLWSVHSACQNTAECFVWDFARAWQGPGYVLARDNYSVTFVSSWFGNTWDLRLWVNCYPGGYVVAGRVGSTW